jgi:hypothetical protein
MEIVFSIIMLVIIWSIWTIGKLDDKFIKSL